MTDRLQVGQDVPGGVFMPESGGWAGRAAVSPQWLE